MATASKKKTGFDVGCPYCKDEDATLGLDLNQFDVIRCSSCDAGFSATEARDFVAAELAKWDRVVRLVELAVGLANE